ncbi:AraC family transcriptional regulator [Chitinophaga sp. CC14]|uniref:AraC family transcriptional regulator n=1 Tax=Chitinophaga sp. CC14 TaxID=3029199 RepID=UPI003B7BD0BF
MTIAMPINYINTPNGIVGFTQKNYEAKWHSHFYIEVGFALSGYLNIKTVEKEYRNVKSVILNSNLKHSFDCLNGECQLYFLDPTSIEGRQILEEFLHDQQILIDEMFSIELFKRKYLSESNEKYIIDSRIEERIGFCLKWIETNYSREDINVAMISEIALLSNSRLAHIFKEQIGSSIHQYILWKKVKEATLLSQKGISLTRCAHALGFTDSSHFNRTFKNMFGTSPYFALKKLC